MKGYEHLLSNDNVKKAVHQIQRCLDVALKYANKALNQGPIKARIRYLRDTRYRVIQRVDRLLRATYVSRSSTPRNLEMNLLSIEGKMVILKPETSWG